MGNNTFEKETRTVDRTKEKVDAMSQWYGYGQDEAGSFPPDEGGKLSPPRRQAGSNDDDFFSFIRKAHLHEAQEFRRKGYNSQVPEVDPILFTQLREAIAAVKPLIYLHAPLEGRLDQSWLLEQIRQLERFIDRLSGSVIQDWVKNELPSKSTVAGGADTLGSRNAAQALVRRLESTLQTLTRVAHALGSIVDYSTPKNLQDAVREVLVSELTNAFASDDEAAVTQALGRMMANAADNAAWSALMHARVTAWEADKPATFGAVIETARRDAEKANKKARELSGSAQAFFSDIATFLQRLSGELTKGLMSSGPDAVPEMIGKTYDDEKATPLQWLKTSPHKLKANFKKGKLQLAIAGTLASKYGRRAARVIQHGHTTATPSKTPENVIADSITRSILWQWQQPAIKIQYASGAILSKVAELKKIKGLFLSGAMTYDNGNEKEDSDISANESSEDDVYTQVRQWVHDRIEQEKPEGQMAAKLTVLSQLLDSDIANARKIVARFGKTQESIQDVLNRQRIAVEKMLDEPLSSDIAAPLKAVNKLLPDIAKDLTGAVAALEKAMLAAEHPARDFIEAKKQANKAQLLAIKVKEYISTKSIWFTERPLDEHSRGARLAKHWANLAKERSRSNWQVPDVEGVFASLKNKGLLDATLSTGDPEGYLFATRLAGELENARDDELKLPMSPDEYVALEKNLVEFIVSWGQKSVTRGTARLVVELSFEQALDTVTVGLASMIRMPYKVLKATIKIPYKVNKINNYTMPGQDRPYKAIYGMLGKKLTHLGFNLVTAPLPGVIKLGIGAGVTAGAAIYNHHVESKEKTFSAVYERMTQGKKSEKIKISSLKGMAFDSAMEGVFMSGFKGIRRAISPLRPGDIIPEERDTQLSPEDEEDKGGIILNNGGVILIEGDREFRSAVRQHIEELQKHPSGRALLEKLKHHVIEIRPPHHEDWLRTEQDGRHYFGSRVVGNVVYFDPYNTYYGSDREEHIEDWRDLHPSIVLFHELLHLYAEDAGHDTIIPSDPNRLDENDYRREFYESREQKVIIRPFTEFHGESDHDVARYAPQRRRARNDFERLIDNHEYKKLSKDKKRLTYLYAINNILMQIQNDNALPEQAQRNAYNARIGISCVVPVDFYGYTATNAFFIPDSPGAKSGILVNLDNENQPYAYVKRGSDIESGLRSNLPDNAHEAGLWRSNGFQAFDHIRRGTWDFNQYFNYNSPTAKNIYELSEQLAVGIEDKYKKRPTIDHNRHVVQKAIVGSQIPDLDVSATPVAYKLEFTWAALTPAEYLRAFSRPFATLAGQGQLVVSHVSGDSIETTENRVEQAKYIGAWIDTTVGAVTSFTGAGIVLGVAQSVAGITADLAEGKDPDPLEVAGLVLNCIPGGKVAGRIGKFSKAGEKGFKFLLQIGRKTVDLTEMGYAIKQAIETGDPLAIYQALIATGMNSVEARNISREMWSRLGKKGSSTEGKTQAGTSVKPQESPSVAKGQETSKPNHSRAASGRKFKIGQTEMLGRKKGKSIEISLDGGVTWKKGSNVHMLAFALQNAGGKSKLPEEGGARKGSVPREPNIVVQDQKRTRPDAEAEFTRHVENEGDPEQYFSRIKSEVPNEKFKTFKFFANVMQGRVRNGVFEVSRNNGDTWEKGWWLQEAVWRFRGRGKLRSTDLDAQINRASKRDPSGYSLACYRGAFNDAQQAGVISFGANDWLINKVARPNDRGEIMDSDNYRQVFGLQNKQPMTNFASANITESGFMHVGERRPDGTIHYDHVVYVHVDKNGIYLYQVNGSDFLLALNGSDASGEYNNIGENVSKSHYKHKMDGDRINLFNQYFNHQGDVAASQSVFTFTSANEVQETYVRHTQGEDGPSKLSGERALSIANGKIDSKPGGNPNNSPSRKLDTERQGADRGDNTASAGKTSTKGSLLFDLEPQPGTSAAQKGIAGVQKESSDMVYPLDNGGAVNSAQSPQQGGRFHKPFGEGSYIEMGPNNNTVIVRAHGYPGDTGHYTADGVAAVIRDYLDSKGIKLQDIRYIELQSCYGNTLGPLSQAQAIANKLQVRVKGYSGKFTPRRGTDPDDGSFSEPYRNPVASAVSNGGNAAAFHVSEAVLSIRRRLGISGSSSTQAGNTETYSLAHISGNTRSSAGGSTRRGRRRRRGRTVIPNGFNAMSLGRSSAGDTAQTGNAATRYINGFTGTGTNRPATRPVYPTDRSTLMPGQSARDSRDPMITGNDLTNTRPSTDAFGQVFLRLVQDIPSHSKAKAGVLIGGMLLLGGVGIYAGKLDYDADEARTALENAENNLSDLKEIMDSDDPDAKAELQTILQHYFGNENLSSEDIQEIIAFIRKVRTAVTNAELNQLISGTLPERFSGDVPAVFARFSPQWIIGFYMHIFGESMVDVSHSGIPGGDGMPLGSTPRRSLTESDVDRPISVVHTGTSDRIVKIRIIRPQKKTT
ncbi:MULTISPECIES: M91 family zinc metallopeptidase [unclassified Burkholderia]|uniref:M91 family zinc metallopeptidase n=1 Tax=unclassified Burkholderia TaxID=2613784 RepID=UPI000AD98E6E|nr:MULTISPECIES: M91 family zinc metallopeptidase [unclassified Burkholderia]